MFFSSRIDRWKYRLKVRNFNILILFKFCQGFPDKISNTQHGKNRVLLFRISDRDMTTSAVQNSSKPVRRSSRRNGYQRPDYWSQATHELAQNDAVMAALIQRYPDSIMSSRGQPFYTLMRSVVGQQISVRAADSIWARLEALCPRMTPRTMLQCTPEQLRSVGLSARKAQYVHEVAQFFVRNRISHRGHDYWAQRSDQAIIDELSGIHGIGRWTAEMFLMFTLLRPNVFPVDDIGLLRGLEKAYHIDQRLTPKQARVLYFERFSPWASVATWYLWRSLDPVEVAY